MQTDNKSLVKLFPQESIVKLEKLNREFKINKITLEVDAWLEHEFGSAQKAAELLQAGNPTAIMKMFYKLLSNDDKIYLSSLKVESEIDEEGNVTEYKNNVQKLLKLSEVNDVENIFASLLRARGVSLPEGFGEGKPKVKVKKK